MDSIAPLTEPVVRSLALAYSLHCKAAGLDSKDTLGKSGISLLLLTMLSLFSLLHVSKIYLDPFFEIAIVHKGVRPVLVYRSEHVDKSLSPEWKPAELALLDIGNPYFPLTVSVYDFDKDGSHDLIGECVLTLDECLLGSLTLPVINHAKKGKYVYFRFFFYFYPLFLLPFYT